LTDLFYHCCWYLPDVHIFRFGGADAFKLPLLPDPHELPLQVQRQIADISSRKIVPPSASSFSRYPSSLTLDVLCVAVERGP